MPRIILAGWIILVGLLLAGLCLAGVAAASRGKTDEPANHALAEAQAAILERHYSEAIHLLRKALKQFPQDDSVRVELGRVYLYKGEGRRAERLFREVLQREPANRLAKLDLARAMAYEGDYKNSNSLYRELLAVNVDDEAALIGLVSNLMHQKQTAEALRVANQGLARHANSLLLQEYRDRLEKGELSGGEQEPVASANGVEVAGEYVGDSSGHRSWRTLQQFDYQFGRGVSNQLAVEERWLRSNEEATRTVESVTDEAELRLTDSVLMNLGAGGARFADGASRTLYQGGFQIHPAKRLWLEAGFSRAPFYPDAKAADFDLTTEGWQTMADWQPGPWRVHAWWSKEHYSDGNASKRGGAEVRRWFGGPRLAFATGYRYTQYDFKQDPRHGYFSPDEYHSDLGLAGIRFHAGKSFHAEYLAWVGAEQISGDAPYKAAWEAFLRNWVTLGNWEVGADYLYFHLVQNTGAFQAQAGSLDVRYRF
ncbi:MAG TPA: tetratricopeptide repeat protein [Terriglobia bacterium]|nr:tetratricopeptide repeat protein [Terriglobia bacterium]